MATEGVDPHLKVNQLRDRLVVYLHLDSELGQALQGLLDLPAGVLLAHLPCPVREVEHLSCSLVVGLYEVVHPLLPGDLHHPGVLQLANVVVDGLGGPGQLLRHLTYGHLLCSEEIDHLPPSLIPD